MKNRWKRVSQGRYIMTTIDIQPRPYAYAFQQSWCDDLFSIPDDTLG